MNKVLYMKEHEELKIKIMMEENPNFWSLNPTTTTTITTTTNMHINSFEQALNNSTSFLSTYVSASPSLALNSYAHDHQFQDLPKSWSQLLLGGLASDDHEEKSCLDHFHIINNNKMENWDDQNLNHTKKEDNSLYGYNEDEVYATTWPQAMPISSPRSCVTTLSNILLETPHTKADEIRSQQSTYSSTSERNSTATGGGGVSKKARVQSSSSSQPPLKVRKEKLGDRITAIHQLVSPFGKTDTASVLLETIGYIRFLQGQIEALSFPYLGNASENMIRTQHSVSNDMVKDLRSRGLCLVPVSYTQQIGRDNGADYWGPAAIGGGLF